MDAIAVVQRAQLLQRFGDFQFTGFEPAECLDEPYAVGVEADVTEIGSSAVVTVEGYGRATEIKRVTVTVTNHFHEVRISGMFGIDFLVQGSHFATAVDQVGRDLHEIGGRHHRLVALKIDYNAVIAPAQPACDFEDTISSAAVLTGGHACLSAEALDLFPYAFIVCGDDNFGGAGLLRGAIHPFDHRPAMNPAQRFSRQALRSVTRRDRDAELNLFH